MLMLRICSFCDAADLVPEVFWLFLLEQLTQEGDEDHLVSRQNMFGG